MDGWNTGDLDAFLQHYSPVVTFDSTRTNGVLVEGREALREYQEEWRAAYEEIAIAADELTDVGNGVVFGVYLQTARPRKASGFLTLREPMIGVLEGGLFVRWIVYPQSETDEARVAAERLAAERE